MSSPACQESSPECLSSSRSVDRSDWVNVWGVGCNVNLDFADWLLTAYTVRRDSELHQS